MPPRPKICEDLLRLGIPDAYSTVDETVMRPKAPQKILFAALLFEIGIAAGALVYFVSVFSM